MVFRWYGEGNDSIPLRHIRQIPSVEGVVWALHDIPVGHEWPLDRILAVKRDAEAHGFNIDVVESVNVHEDIKLGLPSRDAYIDRYAKTIANLAQAGVKVICYNFMPVFDWTRTELYKPMDDGSTAMFYGKAQVEEMDPWDLVNKITRTPNFTMPGWEPERLKELSGLFHAYKSVTEDNLWENLRYFLERIVPVAKRYDIKMAIHPDDPPWPIFGLPRVMTNRENIRRLLDLVDDPVNGLTLCSGALGVNPSNNIPQLIREFSDRIHFAHIRNVKVYDNGDFVETSHRTKDGSLDIYEIVKAYHDVGFQGYVRPDHGRHIFDEQCRPGYGLYDRALGIMYLLGIWDSLERDVV